MLKGLQASLLVSWLIIRVPLSELHDLFVTEEPLALCLPVHLGQFFLSRSNCVLVLVLSGRRWEETQPIM